MTVDLDRFRTDVSRLQAERSKSRSRRETTGTTKAIRAVLSEIYSFRKDGVQWSVIAAALAAQGIVQGKARTPLTTNRLTALVRQIEVQNEKRAAKRAKKGSVTEPQSIAMKNGRLSLSPDQAKTLAIAKGEVLRPRRRNRQASQAAVSQEDRSEQARAIAGRKGPDKSETSRKPSAPQNASGSSKRAVKSSTQSNQDVLAFMDRARAVRRRQD